MRYLFIILIYTLLLSNIYANDLNVSIRTDEGNTSFYHEKIKLNTNLKIIYKTEINEYFIKFDQKGKHIILEWAEVGIFSQVAPHPWGHDNDNIKIKRFFKKNNIMIYDIKKKNIGACEALCCPQGVSIKILVSPNKIPEIYKFLVKNSENGILVADEYRYLIEPYIE